MQQNFLLRIYNKSFLILPSFALSFPAGHQQPPPGRGRPFQLVSGTGPAVWRNTSPVLGSPQSGMRSKLAHPYFWYILQLSGIRKLKSSVKCNS